MNIKPIRNDEDLHTAFARLSEVYQAQMGTPEADEMEVLVTLIEAYENQHYPIAPPDPVDAIRFRMEQQGLTSLVFLTPGCGIRPYAYRFRFCRQFRKIAAR